MEYDIMYGDEAMVAPMVFFRPELLSFIGAGDKRMR